MAEYYMFYGKNRKVNPTAIWESGIVVKLLIPFLIVIAFFRIISMKWARRISVESEVNKINIFSSTVERHVSNAWWDSSIRTKLLQKFCSMSKTEIQWQAIIETIPWRNKNAIHAQAHTFSRVVENLKKTGRDDKGKENGTLWIMVL